MGSYYSDTKQRQKIKGAAIWSDFKLANHSDSQPERTEKIMVILADDHERVRMGLRRLLESSGDIEVIGEAADGQEALDLLDRLDPDVLLLDMEMPRLNGNQVVRRLKEMQSEVRILALSAHDDRQYILGMLENGASGYLTKEEAPEALIKAVRGVANGERGWVSRRVAEKLEAINHRSNLNRLTITDRELEVLHLIIKGHHDAGIAEQLGMPENTVRRHIQILCTKLQADLRRAGQPGSGRRPGIARSGIARPGIAV